jgi:hypothetical protein
MKSHHIFYYQNDQNVTFGSIIKKNGKYIKQFSSALLDDFTLELSMKIKKQQITDLDIFIHGYEAYYEFIKDDLIKKYEKSGLFESEKRLCLHLDWKSLRWYPNNHKQIVLNKLGRINFIQNIASQKQIRVNFICHSMGCYVFSKMVDSFNPSLKQKIGKVVLAAPDMIPSDFRKSDWLMDNGNKILLYAHARDLTLKSASYFRKGERIGRKCPLNIKEIVNYREKPANSDVSEYIIDKIFEHRYFYTDSAVRKTIVDFIFSN